MYIEKKTTGCIIEPPDERDYKYEIIAGSSDEELPEQFVIKDVPHLYQNGIDSCVGNATAAAKSVQEKEKLSPRYQWHLAKKEQGYKGWGTRISITLKQLIKNGALPYGLFDEEVVGVDREDYMRLELDESKKLLAQKYRAKSYWRASYGATNIAAIKKALYEQKVPLITAMTWYSSYNETTKGFLKPGGRGSSAGHSFICKGWNVDKKGREYFIFQNSWKKTWGDKGDFYIYTDEMYLFGLGGFYVLVDIEQDKANIIANYQDKLIKNENSPKVYYVGTEIAWIEDEAKFEYGRDQGWWGDWDDIITIQPHISEEITF